MSACDVTSQPPWRRCGGSHRVGGVRLQMLRACLLVPAFIPTTAACHQCVQVVYNLKQKGWPKDLYEVRMYALRPRAAAGADAEGAASAANGNAEAAGQAAAAGAMDE